MVAMDFFAASNSYDFFNQYCSNLLKNLMVRGLRLYYFYSKADWSIHADMNLYFTLTLKLYFLLPHAMIYRSLVPLQLYSRQKYSILIYIHVYICCVSLSGFESARNC